MGNILRVLILFSLFSVCCSNQSYGQEKINISAGVGFPELINLGLRYQFGQAQIGISIGSFPPKNSNLFSLSGDVSYHFAGLSELSTRRLWYGRIGLNYYKKETARAIYRTLYLNLRIGKEFNFSKKIGMEISAGAIYELANETIRKEPLTGKEIHLDLDVLPSLGIGFFYRI